MGTFKDHINQSYANLSFLSKINESIDDCWDWQVTVCFYSALHMINAHIVKIMGANYLSHSKVDEIINPYNKMSIAKLDEETYTAYQVLFQLSRRSRYLLNENYRKDKGRELQIASLTYSKHLGKAVRHLDTIINFMKSTHDECIPKVNIKCVDLKNASLVNFIV